MFFSKGDIEKLPKKLQEELEEFYKKYEEMHDLYDDGKNIGKKSIDCFIFSLNLYLVWKNKVNRGIKDLLGEALGEIPIMLIMDKIKLPKDIKEVIGPLIDIELAHSNLHINRERLVMEVLGKLKRLKKKYKS